jgi:hypothetical protein
VWARAGLTIGAVDRRPPNKVYDSALILIG